MEEMITNVETEEVVVDEKFVSLFKGVGIGLGIAGIGYLAYKFGVKPMVTKIKEKRKSEDEYEEVSENE